MNKPDSTISHQEANTNSYYERKNSQHRDNKIDELIQTRDPLNFWTNLKSLSNQKQTPLDSTIPMHKLYNHFQQLHSTPNANLLKKQEEIIKELEHKKNSTIAA